MKSIHIMAAKELPAQIEIVKPVAVLSIEHPGATDDDGRAPRLHTACGIKGVFQYIQCYWDIEKDHPEGPRMHHVAEGLHFLLHHVQNGPVAVHCRRGASRSAAMGLAFLVAANPDVPIPDVIKHLKQIRPMAAPNIRIVRCADRFLDKWYALTDAVLNDAVLTAARAEANRRRAAWAEANPGWDKSVLRPI